MDNSQEEVEGWELATRPFLTAPESSHSRGVGWIIEEINRLYSNGLWSSSGSVQGDGFTMGTD